MTSVKLTFQLSIPKFENALRFASIFAVHHHSSGLNQLHWIANQKLE